MIKANFNTYASYVTDSLHQWDLNQVLQVTGLNLATAPEVHFSNANTDRAIVRQATMTDRVISVGVPNSLLQDPLRIYAHIGIYEGSTFKVVELVGIPVKPRKRPVDYQIQDSDEEVYSFKRLENMLASVQNGRLPAIESTDHPGCYFTTVNGETQWINPPMVMGVEYRTAERWDNKPVYTKLVNLGAASNGKKVAHGITTTGIIRAAGKLSNIPMPVYNSENFNAEISVSDKEVKISETGYDGVLCTAQLWYVK